MKVLKKLQKLISHAESARDIGNIAEAAAFAERIQILLDKHNLSMSDVEVHNLQESPVDMDPVQTELIEVKNWQRVLLNNIAQANGCYALEHHRGFQIVIGRKTDRQIVLKLYHYFENLGRERAAKLVISHSPMSLDLNFWMTDFEANTPTAEEVDSFLLGFSASIAKRLQETSQKDNESSAHSTALVFLGNRQADNQKFIKAKLNVEPAKLDTSDTDRRAFHRGAAAGDRVALTDKTLEK